jgi:hypothetical protein
MLGKILIYIGIFVIIIGAGILFFPKLFSWFGHLPGDIHIERKNSSLFVPIGSMVLISIILTIVINGVIFFINYLSRFK